MKIIKILLLAVLFSTNLVAQQFDLSAEIRPRFENKHGYKLYCLPMPMVLALFHSDQD